MENNMEQSPHRNVVKAEALVTAGNADFMQLVEWLERGAENVYLVDEAGRYLWRAARKNQHPIVYGERGYGLSLAPLEPIVFDDPIDDAHVQSLMAVGESIFARHPEEKELPIVNSGGGQSYALCVQKQRKHLGIGKYLRRTKFADFCRRGRAASMCPVCETSIWLRFVRRSERSLRSVL